MQNKPVALVTGANKGIGLQIARDLSGHGYTVLVGARDPDAGMRAAEEVGADAHAVLLDVTDQKSVDAAAERAAELGGAVLSPPADDVVGRTAVLADPQGAPFAVSRVVPA